ncbi:ATP-dependent endonuclease [uncultured Neglectibacter sp.]|uniref:ATP-dependent nuclease n=1 Tax=uncultured Neglectibacter sp. TaxID=1924108 RepID=UPI0034DF3C5A
MRIQSINIQNFRKLLQCNIDFSEKATLFVGANNSGKTSAMDALGKFLADRNFTFNDITISKRVDINKIGEGWTQESCNEPIDLLEWESLVPQMDIWLDVSNSEIHYVAGIIPTLKWRGGKLGVRLAFFPKNISKLFAEYRETYFAARKTEKAKGKVDINLYPKDLCEFLERNLNAYFSMKAFILDPAQSNKDLPQATPFEMECFTDNPLKGIIKVDMIDAQRGFADPDSSDSNERAKRQLSDQMRSYYDKHLDPEKSPSPEDLDILKATEDAKKAFDKNLAIKFAPAIHELEGLGYPGVADPRLTIVTKMTTAETLKHDSAVQYALSKKDDTLKLPEKYNGLGYQNLISMVFDLMRFRDDWMREGKAKRTQENDNPVIEPLHLVLVEEPEAHLHVQVQQVFIRKSYDVLTNHKFIKENEHFDTQLVISTHSSHIARETNFADLRYFKRLSEGSEGNIATSKVINLSEVFGKGDETGKFVTRYLQTTHCDLFFADAAILVEGSAENMLLPHFIRNKYPGLYQRYISILSINGRHSHRLNPLLEKLCLPTLVIADLDTAEKEGHHKAAFPERGKGLISSNYTITGWIVGKKDLDELLAIPFAKKEVVKEGACKYSIRIAYQTPVMINYNGTDKEALASTFEDCLVYTNFQLFKDMPSDDTGSLIKNVSDKVKSVSSFDKLHKGIYDALRDGKSDQKAEFALDLIYAVDPSELTVPAYIAEGLEWLQAYLKPEE